MSPTAESPPYIWITRWEDFQHYPPERDRPPAWIKTYTKQLDDDRYLDLSLVQRALLHDLRSAFARSHGRLSSVPRQLTWRIGARVTSAQLEALNHAGFIQFISRETLEQRLEEFYSSRAPARSQRSREREEPSVVETNPVSTTAETAIAKSNGTAPTTDTAQTLTAEYVDACHNHEIETPRRLIGQIAQATAQLLGEGVDPDRIRAGYRRMVTRGIVQPSLLPNFVAEASIPTELTRNPNAGLTGDQITEIGRRMSQ